jgi:hypothetical protein
MTKRQGVQLVKREENVARNDELCLSVAPDGERRQRIVARHVSVDDLYSMVAHETSEFERARDIERITKTQGEDVSTRQGFEFMTKR